MGQHLFYFLEFFYLVLFLVQFGFLLLQLLVDVFFDLLQCSYLFQLRFLLHQQLLNSQLLSFCFPLENILFHSQPFLMKSNGLNLLFEFFVD